METRGRSLMKAVTWQLWGLLTMGLIGLAFTGSAISGGALALTSAAVGLVCYLAHERLWSRVSWGRHHH